jgi:hypothetical protein
MFCRIAFLSAAFETVAAGSGQLLTVELPTGDRGAIPLDGVLHLIATRDAHPIAGSTVPVLNLLVGWVYLNPAARHGSVNSTDRTTILRRWTLPRSRRS